MKTERSDVEFPIWRKNVDKSLFHYGGTVVPEWACKMWNFQSIYADVNSKSDPRSPTSISYRRKRYDGWVTVVKYSRETVAKYGRKVPTFRLWYEPSLILELKRSFLMSYMRALEGDLARENDVESEIPFWEFLDIEFDEKQKPFKFVDYYVQQPSFPHLFSRLIESPTIRKVDDEIESKAGRKIYKQDWKHRSEVEFEIGAKNVIYTLIDTKAESIYIGEAADLVKRLVQPHPSIPNWDRFRYNVLPDALAPFRVALERMIIRDFAGLFANKKGCTWHDCSGFQLANDKIDR
jgi:hypothetical protein